jgi:hypothetical protein
LNAYTSIRCCCCQTVRYVQIIHGVRFVFAQHGCVSCMCHAAAALVCASCLRYAAAALVRDTCLRYAVAELICGPLSTHKILTQCLLSRRNTQFTGKHTSCGSVTPKQVCYKQLQNSWPALFNSSAVADRNCEPQTRLLFTVPGCPPLQTSHFR